MFASYPTWHALHHHLHQDAHDQGRHQPQQKTHTHAVIQVIVPGEVPLKHATLPVTQPELHRYKPTMLPETIASTPMTLFVHAYMQMLVVHFQVQVEDTLVTLPHNVYSKMLLEKPISYPPVFKYLLQLQTLSRSPILR